MTQWFDPIRHGQKPGYNPLTFFLLKRHHFDLKKKRIDPGDPVTRSKPGTRALDRVGSKNYGFKLIFHSIIKDFILIKFL